MYFVFNKYSQWINGLCDKYQLYVCMRVYYLSVANIVNLWLDVPILLDGSSENVQIPWEIIILHGCQMFPRVVLSIFPFKNTLNKFMSKNPR